MIRCWFMGNAGKKYPNSWHYEQVFSDAPLLCRIIFVFELLTGGDSSKSFDPRASSFSGLQWSTSESWVSFFGVNKFLLKSERKEIFNQNRKENTRVQGSVTEWLPVHSQPGELSFLHDGLSKYTKFCIFFKSGLLKERNYSTERRQIGRVKTAWVGVLKFFLGRFRLPKTRNGAFQNSIILFFRNWNLGALLILFTAKVRPFAGRKSKKPDVTTHRRVVAASDVLHVGKKPFEIIERLPEYKKFRRLIRNRSCTNARCALHLVYAFVSSRQRHRDFDTCRMQRGDCGKRLKQGLRRDRPDSDCC